MNEQTQDINLKQAMRQRLIGLLRKPQAEKKEKRPANKLWVANIGFNLTMFFLDLVSAITVAMLTNAMYGVMTFLAGFLALLLHENLFSNAHANWKQKYIAIGGMLLAILSTVGIGVLAGIVNVANIVGLLPAQSLEMGLIVSLVVIAGIHGGLWGIYYHIDEGHKAEMRAVENAAYRERQRRDFDNAKKDILAVKEIDKEIRDMDEIDSDLLSEAYRENTGRELITKKPAPISTPAGELTDEGFKYHAETPSGKSFRPNDEL